MRGKFAGFFRDNTVIKEVDELMKILPYKKDGSDDAAWFSHLHREQRKKKLSKDSKELVRVMEGSFMGSQGTATTCVNFGLPAGDK